MDWGKAIAINQAALIRIISALIAMAGLSEGAKLRLEQPVYRAVLKVLRPAEAAVRRLIVIAARGVKGELPMPRPFPKGLTAAGARVSFQLLDARGRYHPARSASAAAKAEPR